MADIGNTKAAVAVQRLNLHRSSPYDVEITAPDSTASYPCGEEVAPPLKQIDIEVTNVPAVPDWVDQHPVMLDIDSMKPELPSG